MPEHEMIKKQMKPKLEQFYEQNRPGDQYLWEEKKKPQTSKMITNYRYANHQKEWYTKEETDAIVWKPLSKMFQHLSVPIQDCILAQFWWNVYQPGDHAIFHNHGSDGISGIYLLELNERNKTIFHQDNSIHFKRSYNVESHYTNDAKEGTVLLFPSQLNHSVDPAESTRMTISFNVEIR
jgi:hypothetical protein